MKYDPVKVPLDSAMVERNTRNECINEIRPRIPEALWDKISEDLVRAQYNKSINLSIDHELNPLKFYPIMLLEYEGEFH